MHMSPAEYVINILGGVRATAKVVNRTPAAVCYWRTGPRSGHIPTSVQPIILKYAVKKGLDISALDLIYGRKLRKSSKFKK